MPRDTVVPMGVTVGAFFERFRALHITRLAQARKTEVRCREYFVPFWHRPLGSLTRRDIAQWHAYIGQTKPQTANKVLTHLKTLFNKAVEWEVYDGRNPCQGIKQFPAHSRTRLVQPGEEMTRLQASLAREQPEVQAFFVMLLLTGARRSEVRMVKWDELDLTHGLWTKYTTKTHRAQTVPIPNLLVERLGALPRRGPYVFTPRDNHRGHRTSRQHPWAEARVAGFWDRIRARAGIEDVTIHDLRRTCATSLLAILRREPKRHSAGAEPHHPEARGDLRAAQLSSRADGAGAECATDTGDSASPTAPAPSPRQDIVGRSTRKASAKKRSRREEEQERPG